MSHAYGQVKFQDGTIMHFEYNGTVDSVITKLWATSQEVSDHWREYKMPSCNCGNDELVKIAADYGHGQWWIGRACKECMAITAPLGESYIEKQYSLPDWWESDEPLGQ